MTLPNMQRCLLTLILVLLFSGCQSYREGGSRTVGEFTDDIAVQTKVKTKLIRDEDINGLRINVEVTRGVVTLYGRIPSKYARDKAVGLVRDIRGVKAVEDRLIVAEQ